MSELLDELVKQRKRADIEYAEYLAKIVELTQQVKLPEQSEHYPTNVDTRAKQALYDNLGQDEAEATALNAAIVGALEDNWRGHLQKERRVKNAIRGAIPGISDDELKTLFELVKNQHEY